jgi:hypothetical protein
VDAPGEMSSSRYELMVQRDRRNVGIVVLRHREAGRVLNVIPAYNLYTSVIRNTKVRYRYISYIPA